MAVLSTSLGFVGIMMLLSVMGKTEQSAGGIGWSVLMVISMIGGGMIPLFVMPSWMRTISHFSPVKWAILAMEGALWRRFTFQEMLLPCGILIGVGLVFFIVGVRLFQWSTE
jgi:ABC-2 type transport system permease protein